MPADQEAPPPSDEAPHQDGEAPTDETPPPADQGPPPADATPHHDGGAPTDETPPATDATEPETLASLLGGRRAGIEATLPAVGFVAGWLVADQSIGWGVTIAMTTAGMVAVVGLRRGRRPRAVVLGLLGVSVAALVALRTGRAADFFLVQVVANIASAVAWAGSIVMRWPLLGVVVGGVLGQRTRWRRDPDLLRAYSRASWVWVAQYVVRVAVFTPLWLADQVVALGAARVLLSWPLVAAVLASSWLVLRRSLPDGHPGLRHPRVAHS